MASRTIGCCAEQVEESYLSEPESIEFPTEDGLTAYMNYYRPRNDHYRREPYPRTPFSVFHIASRPFV